MKTSISQKICTFYKNVSLDCISDDAWKRAKYCTLDFLGNAIGASNIATTQKLKSVMLAAGSTSDCSVCCDAKAPADKAAFVNASAGHSFDMDDQFLEAGAHPGVMVVPAALAVAEETASSGREFLASVIWGYDMLTRIGRSFPLEEAFRRGWHPCSCMGVFGAATAASYLMKLSVDQMANALGIAGSFASGNLECYGDGSNTKRIQPGHSASSGVIAAKLAATDYRGPLYIFEGQRSFIKTYFGGGDPEKMLIDLDCNGFLITRGSFKPYAACRGVHPSVDVIKAIMAEHSLTASDIERIHLDIPSSVELIVVEPRSERYHPINPDNAQFSLPYAASCAALFGDLSIKHFTREILDSKELQDMMSRIEIVHTGEMDAWQPYRLAVHATITARNGEEFSQRLINCKGDPENPMTDQELQNKFLSLCELTIPRSRAEEICNRILRLEDIEDIHELTELL